MPHATHNGFYAPAQVAAVTGLPLAAVHKALEHKLIRPKVVHEGGSPRRKLSRAQAIFLRLEAKGLKSLPLPERRRIAQAIERDPETDGMCLSGGSVVLIECKAARRDVDAALRRLASAERMVHADPEILRGAPVYKGTRIPVHSIAEMLAQGSPVEQILEGYPALTREKVELAPLYAKAFPRRGRPVVRPWAKRPPRRISRRPLAG
jgi:uncharacterized protein (DUF433 family)